MLLGNATAAPVAQLQLKCLLSPLLSIEATGKGLNTYKSMNFVCSYAMNAENLRGARRFFFADSAFTADSTDAQPEFTAETRRTRTSSCTWPGNESEEDVRVLR